MRCRWKVYFGLWVTSLSNSQDRVINLRLRAHDCRSVVLGVLAFRRTRCDFFFLTGSIERIDDFIARSTVAESRGALPRSSVAAIPAVRHDALK